MAAAKRAPKKEKKVWYIFKRAEKWYGPFFKESLADEACIRARRDGHLGVYVERIA